MTNPFKKKKEPMAIVLHELIIILDCEITYGAIEEKLLQHPAYPTLYCITNTLANFGIENKAVRLKPEQFSRLETPFLATTRFAETVLVKAVEEGRVHYFVPSQGWKNTLLSHFLEIWNHMVVLVDTEVTVEEEDYKKKKDRENLRNLKWPIAFSILVLLLIAIAISLGTSPVLPYLISKVLGLSVSLLLINKEINKNTEYSFCELGSKISCEDVLNSPAAKIFPWLSMTDLGLLYFTSTVLALAVSTIVPMSTATTVLKLSIFLGFISLPYTLFSMAYQGFVIKKWCPLCLATVGILWIESLIGYFFWSTIGFSFNLELNAFIIFIFCLLIPGVLWMFLKDLISKSADFDYYRFSHLRMINDMVIFELAQQKQKDVDMDLQPSEIILGEPKSSNQLVIAINPFCQACGREFKSVLKLLHEHPEYASVIIRFVGSFNDKDERKPYTAALLIDHYLNDPSNFSDLLKNWFENRNLREFVKLHPVVHTQTSEEIVKHHYFWSEKVNIVVTPTAYLNGKRLSERHHLEHLINMLDMAR